jgi:hypothetical protein
MTNTRHTVPQARLAASSQSGTAVFVLQDTRPKARRPRPEPAIGQTENFIILSLSRNGLARPKVIADRALQFADAGETSLIQPYDVEFDCDEAQFALVGNSDAHRQPTEFNDLLLHDCRSNLVIVSDDVHLAWSRCTVSMRR